MSGFDGPSLERGYSNSFQMFHDLMPFHVQNILLVSSLYDSFILEQDGQLNELILGEFLDLNLRHTPTLTHVSSGAEALQLAQEQPRYNLIVTTLEPGDMDAAELAQRVCDAGLEVPVCALAYDGTELNDFLTRHPRSALDRIFIWQGNARILLAIVKYVEDRRNAPHDTRTAGVRVVLVVEDNIRYYSSFLPIIYGELIAQAQSLISDAVNLPHKLVRMRARPKILLCSSFEEAWDAFTTYKDFVLGVISDIEFPHRQVLRKDAGFALAQAVKQSSPDLPILLQSGDPEAEQAAWDVGASFLLKDSPSLLADLSHFMKERFAFGDFIFRTPDGREVGRASDLRTLEEQLHRVPAVSIAYHAERNHFSNWLIARTEFAVAYRLRPGKVSDYPDHEALRADLIRNITEYRREQGEVLLGDFGRAAFHPDSSFARIGGGSMGGKARGLAFARHLLGLNQLGRAFPGVRIAVPPTVVVGTDVFDAFLSRNGLQDLAFKSLPNEEIRRRVLAAEFPPEHLDDLAAFLDAARYPLAVRSSSLLEDSQYQPFTGVYETLMLANSAADPAARLRQLVDAIKRVYASTFFAHARRYLQASAYRLEEEKMAVILQRLVGAPHGDRFYPDFAGVARSHNFYPVAPQRSEDGIATVALGLGRTVVEGEKSLSFCPRYPRHLVQFSSVKDILNLSQREFWALRLDGQAAAAEGEHDELRAARFDLSAAQEDGTLGPLASVYSHANGAIYDGLARPGVPLVSFAPILKHDAFPLAAVLARLLELGSRAVGRPVEIEFAARLSGPLGEPKEFAFLQIRPLALSRETEELVIGETAPGQLLCQSTQVLGHGQSDTLYDVVAVDLRRFQRSRSREAAQEVARFNALLADEGRSYVLVGVGRWGSTDPWLGIPVTWDQISHARAIVEAGFSDLRVTPSQGSHFFQNLAEFQVGYFTVNPELGEGFVDWDWLAEQPALAEGALVRHLRFTEPFVVKMNGRRNEGVIYKPGQCKEA